MSQHYSYNELYAKIRSNYRVTIINEFGFGAVPVSGRTHEGARHPILLLVALVAPPAGCEVALSADRGKQIAK